jgi:hypothetical protein
MNHLPLLDLFARAPSPLQTLVFALAALVVAMQLAIVLLSRLAKFAPAVTKAVQAWRQAIRGLRHGADDD